MRDSAPTNYRVTGRYRRWLSDACHVLLCVTAFVAITIIWTLGVMVAFILLAVDGRPDRFFAEVANLAAHYLAAPAAVRALFDRQLLALFGMLAAILALARLPLFVARLWADLRRGPRR